MPAQLAASAFSQLSMPAVLVTGPTVTQDSPFSSLAVAVTIASSHFAYAQRNDQAELAWVAWLNTEKVYPRTVTHLSTNLARCRVTSLMCATMLPLCLTATTTTLTDTIWYMTTATQPRYSWHNLHYNDKWINKTSLTQDTDTYRGTDTAVSSCINIPF